MYHLKRPLFWALFIAIGLPTTYALEIVAMGLMPDYQTNPYLPCIAEFLAFLTSFCIAYFSAKTCVARAKRSGFPILPAKTANRRLK